MKSFEIVRLINDLDHKQNIFARAHLAYRMSYAIRVNLGVDVSEKIKGMISDMSEKLKKEHVEAADIKQRCDNESAEATAKEDGSSAIPEKFNRKVAAEATQSKQSKEEISNRGTNACVTKIVDGLKDSTVMPMETLSTNVVAGVDLELEQTTTNADIKATVSLDSFSEDFIIIADIAPSDHTQEIKFLI